MNNKIKKIWFSINNEKGDRKYIRINLHHLIKYKIKDSGEKKLSFAQNLSAGGALVYLSQAVRPGDLIRLEILFPFCSEPVKVEAQAIRSKYLKKFKKYKVGLKFIEIDQKIKEKIIKKFKELEKIK
ncbi:MAG: PilZ domain-containing protein [Candidatus Omnitrophota bacterium]